MAEFFVKNARLSFPALFTAEEFEAGSGMKYGCTLLIPKDDPQVKAINAEIDRVGTEKFKDKWPALKKAAGDNNQKICFWTGDTKAYDGYEGNMALTTRRPLEGGRPVIVDRNKAPLSAEDGRPYGGCYVHAKVEFWAQDNKFGKTVRCTLVGVQFAKDGEQFSGVKAATDAGFEDLGEEESLV